MALDAQKAIIGPAFVSLDGTDLGFTSTEGVSFNEEFDNVEFEAAQTLVIPRVHRERVRAVISATFHQLDLENFRLLSDLNNAPAAGAIKGAWNHTPTERILTLTMPGPNGSTRVLTARAIVLTSGEKVISNGAYTGAPVEFGLLGDPVENELYSIIETAGSSVAPVVASYQKIVGETTTTITDEEVGVDPAAALQWTFNVSIRPDMLTPSRFMLLEGGAQVAGTLTYGQTASAVDYTKVVFTPAAPLDASTGHQLIAVQGIRSVEGAQLAATASITFTTDTP